MKTDDITTMLAMNRKRGTPCWFAQLSSPELAATVTEAMDHPGITSSTISRWLIDHGVQVQQQAVQRHRRNDCACNRD